MHQAVSVIVGGALFAALLVVSGTAQAPDRPERKVVSRVAAVYPDVAKRNRISGIVRLEIVIQANGVVKSTKALGGNPILIGPAIVAVRKWRFEAASAASTEVVQITFDAN